MATVGWQAFKSIGEGECLAPAGEVSLKSFRHMPAFLRMSNAIRDQLAASPGLVGYSLRVHFLSRRFWTLSVWESQYALDEFVRRMPHAEAMRVLQPHTRNPIFVTWTLTAAEVPPGWREALEHLRHAAVRG